MNSNIDFLSVWLETILFSSTEITDFSSQLTFFLANIKSKIRQLYVIWRHHYQSTRGSYLPLLIFSYKGISALYLLYAKIAIFKITIFKKMGFLAKKCPKDNFFTKSKCKSLQKFKIEIYIKFQHSLQ